jgi:hypothetical protein
MHIFSHNFLTQMAVNPVFGNLKADTLTTGNGTYVHSLLSIFSHLGLVGAALFSAYLGSLYNSFKKTKLFAGPGFYHDSECGVFRLILISIVLSFALLATFFTWLPLWFAIGLFFPPLVVQKSHLPRAVRYRDDVALTPGHLRAANFVV